MLKAATAAASSSGASGMIWVRNAQNVHIENLYIEVNGQTAFDFGCFCNVTRAKEGIVATGNINGLTLLDNYIKITSGTGTIAIGINVNGTTDSSVPTSEARVSGNYVTLDGNVVEPTASPAAAPKRAIAMENQVGLVRGNLLAATTQDLWIQYANANPSAPAAQRLLTIEDNWFFGKLQLYLTNGYNLSGPTHIRNNQFVLYGSTFSPPGMPSISLGNGSEAQSVRLMNPYGAQTIVEGNHFKGFRGDYRALWIQNRADVRVQDNVFTPDPAQSDFTAIVVGNRDVWNGVSTPAAFGATFLRNTFQANGATASNKAKAILFVNDNDPTGVAPGGPLQVGDGTQANANLFDAGIGWYLALDDRTCSGNNHNGSGGSCNGTAAYAIGIGIAYSGGSSASTQKRPFRWNVSASGNTFGGVFMPAMTEAQYNAVLARTYDDRNNTIAAADVGEVDYGYTPRTTGTVAWSGLDSTYDGSAHAVTASLVEEPSATCTVTPALVGPNAGATPVQASCSGVTHVASASATATIARAVSAVELEQSSFDYTNAPHALTARLAAEPSTLCATTPASIQEIGVHAINVPACTGANHQSLAASLSATVGGGTSVHVVETGNYYATVAAALDDPATLGGYTIELAPGVYLGPIVLTKAVRLQGGAGFTPSKQGTGPVLTAGPVAAPATVIDGGNAAATGISVSAGVVGASIAGFEIRNFTQNCIHAPAGNDGLVVEQNLIHHCGLHGVLVGGIAPTGINDVVIDHNEVHSYGGRGIVVWDGIKRDITISHNEVHNAGGTGCCGIELQDGAATGAWITDNVVYDMVDSAIGLVQLTSGSPSARINHVARNTVTSQGRFGIEIKIPNGSGAASGDGAIVVEDNIVDGTGLRSLRDRAGIAVFRRAFGTYPYQVDRTRGVIISDNTVSGFRTGLAGYEGYGIVVEGVDSTVLRNALAGNDVGLQVQQGNPDRVVTAYNPAVLEGDQNAQTPWFNRGDATATCVSVGEGADANLISASATVDQRLVPAGTPMIGARVLNEDTGARYCSINAAIAAAVPGEHLLLDAGVFAEDVVIDRALTIRGAKHGQAAGVGSTRDPSSGETILVPATIEAGLSLSSSTNAVVFINADGVVLDGLLIDGDNPLLTSPVMLNGANPDVSLGVEAVGSQLQLRNLVLRNFVFSGIAGYATSGSEGNNAIRDNRFTNITAPAAYGIGVVLLNNFYADVGDNLMDQVRVGVQTNNNWLAAPAGSIASISGNEMHAARAGIFHNLFYSGASPYTIANNVISASANAALTGQWNGIWVESMQSAQTVAISANTIDASAIPTRERIGYLINNLVSSEAANTAIDGGGVSHVDIGVLATDATLYTGPVNDIAVRNVDFLEVSRGAFYVEDTVEVAGSARLTIGSGNTFNAVAHELVLSGAAPTVGGSAADVLVRSSRNYLYGVAGNAPCSPAACTVADASINGGIAAAAIGGTVHVEAGDFSEYVTLGKAVTLAGPHAGVHGDDAARGSAEAVIRQVAPGSGGCSAHAPLTIESAGAVVDGIEIDGTVGGCAVRFNTALGTSGIRFVNNRVLDFASTHSSGGALFVNGTTGLEIAGNLLEDFRNNVPSGFWAMGIKLMNSVGANVHDNTMRAVQSVNIQLSSTSATNVHHNAIDGITPPGTGNAGIQLAATSTTLVRDNTIANMDSGLLLTPNNAATSSLVCNTVSTSTRGLFAMGSPWTGTHVIGPVLHNALLGNATPVLSTWSPNALVVGSNWYGSGVPAPASGTALVADALAANPVGHASCGDNTPHAVVTHAGTSPQSAEVGTAFAPLRARVEDILGGAVAGQAVVFASPSSGASATLGSPSGTSNHNGEWVTSAVANTTVGSYAVDATSGALSVPFALTNTQGTAIIAFDAGTLNQVYTGGPRIVTASTVPVGLAYSVTYDGSATPPTAAGSHAVVATVTDPSYAGSTSATLVVAKATGTVAWDDLAFTYDGNVHAVTAHIAEEPASACTVTGTVGPGVGGYTLAATCTGSNYDASGSATATVSAQAVTITLSHLTQAYDGSPKSVVATTAPVAGVALAITYDGSPVAPTAVGSYAVVATLTDANYSAAPATGTLQIVTGGSDIALVLNGPVDPVHVGDVAQYAATMLANPLLHAGETFGYRVVVSKAGGTHALALADLATMEVFYAGAWVDATTFFGTIPFTIDGNGDLVYVFPEGIPGYANGFAIEDPSWTWNFRFTFADTGTYTTTAELVDGVSHAPVAPAVTASIATVVVDALAPDDMHLVLGGPAGEVEVGAFAEYNGTLIADPAEHAGETFFVKVRLSRSGGTLVPADLAQTQIHLGGTWVDGASLGVVFVQDGDDLVYYFPQSQMPGGFPIEDPQWTWNFRIAFAQAGVYTATAEVIPAADAGNPNPDVLAAAALATTVVPAVVIPPQMHLVVLGPVDDVQANTPATYTGTLIADPDDFAGRRFWVRVRLSKNGGADAMAIADLARMEIHQGTWQDVTSSLQPMLIDDGNDLVYLFPQPASMTGFAIDEPLWTWNFRFTYATPGLYRAVADVIDVAEADPLAAASLAGALVSTRVVAQTSDIELQLQGPVAGVVVGQPAQYVGTLRADPLPDPSTLYYVNVRLHKSTGAMSAADLADMEIFAGGSWQSGNALGVVFTEDNGDLVYQFPRPLMDDGFPIDEPEWSWQFRFTFATAATYTATAQVVQAADLVPASDAVSISTTVEAEQPDIALALNGPVADVQVDVPAIYLGTLVNNGPALGENAYVKVRVELAGQTLSAGDIGAEVSDGAGGWLPGTLVEVDDGLEVDFPDANGFAVGTGFGYTHTFRLTYHRAGVFSASAQVVGTPSSVVYATAGMYTEVIPRAAVVAGILFDPASLHAVYDGNAHAAVATTTPAGLPVTMSYNGLPTAPTRAGSHVVVATVNSAPYVGSASAVLTIDKAIGSVNLAPLSAPYGSVHAVTATLAPADSNASCSVTGVPAQNAAPGSYAISASCSSDNYTASASANYVVLASSASISAVVAGPVGVVTVDPQPTADAKKTLYAWRTNGSAGEPVRAAFVITSAGHAQAGDLALEYFETTSSSWMPLPLAFSGGQWTGSFGPASGFPLVDGATSQFRATFHKGGRYTTTASIVGVGSGLVLATSAAQVTDVAELALGGIANAAGRVGESVETALTLANDGSAALSGGGAGNPVPAQPAPNDENVRGRFTISWSGGALVPADTSGPGGNCGAPSCASPDVGIEYYDAVSGTYRPIYNLRLAEDGESLYGHFGSLASGGVPVPAGYSASTLFRTTFKRNVGNYAVNWQVVGIATGTVYAQAPVQTIGIDTGAGASIAIVGGDGGTATVGGNAYDQGDLVVEVRDIGNNPVAGATVAFNALPGADGASASFAAPVATDANGRTAIHALSNAHAGVFGIGASLSSGVSLAQPFAMENVADRDPAQVQISIVSGDGQTAQVGTAYALPLVARVADRFGNALSGIDVAFASLGATLAHDDDSTDANGLADTGTVTAGLAAGPFAVTATLDGAQCDDASLDATCTVAFELANTAGGAAAIELASAVGSAEVGTANAYLLTATVRDANANAVAGVSVTLIGPSSGAGIAPSVHTGITDANGQVSRALDANTVAGTFTVQAVVSGAPADSVALENLPGAAAKIVLVSGDAQSTPVGSAFGSDLVVRVLDLHDNPVADDAAAEVNFLAPPSTGASATVSASVTSGAGGFASTAASANGVAGSYSVVASFDDHDVAFALTNSVGAVTIGDPVWLANGNTSVAYDGSAKVATASVTGSSLAPTFTYNGIGAAPVAAGTYHVVATIDDGNVQGSASAMLTITPAGAGASGIVLTGGTYTFDGSAKPATVTNPNGVGYTLAYSTVDGLAPINAGSYTASLTVTDPNHASETLTAAIVIAKAAGTVDFGATAFTFDGTPHATTAVIAQEPGNATACTIGSPDAYPRTNAGSSALSATCDGVNHTASGTATLVVAPKPVTIALAGLGSFPYDGNVHAATASVVGEVAGFPAATVLTYNGAGAAPSAVGVYDVLATLAPAASNYSAPAANGTIIIGAANATVAIANLAQVYDGTPRPVTVTTNPTGLATSVTYDGSATPPSNAGTYTVVATITAPGYSGSASATLVVARAAATVTLSNLAQAYDGTPRAVTVTTSPAALSISVSYDGSPTPPTAVGSYTVVATITDPNHTGSASATLVVTHGAADAIVANGATTFTGIAGQPLTGALPSVRVVDEGGNPVQGAVLTFAAGASSGVLSGATQTTNQDGIATLGGWTLDPVAGTDTVTATAAGVGGSVVFTATSTVSAAGLSVTVGDGRNFAQFERTLTWTITVGNAGPSSLGGIAVQAALPPELLVSGASWQCIAVAGATCTGSGTGNLADSVNLPAGSSAVYLLTALTTRDGGDRISLTVEATGPAGVVSATDVTDLVFFRDGFDPGGDGSNGVDAPLAAIDLPAHGELLVIDLARAPSRTLVVQTLVAADDGAFGVELVRIGADAWVRLVARDGRATAWSRVGDDGLIALSIEVDGVLLAGTGDTLALAVDAVGTTALRVPGD